MINFYLLMIFLFILFLVLLSFQKQTEHLDNPNVESELSTLTLRVNEIEEKVNEINKKIKEFEEAVSD